MLARCPGTPCLLLLLTGACADPPTTQARGPFAGRRPPASRGATTPQVDDDEAAEIEGDPEPAERPVRAGAVGLPPCPPGAEPRGGGPPEELEYSCVRRQEDGSAVLHGPYRRWSPDGDTLVAEGAYRDGKKHGAWTERYPDGTSKSRAEYREGVYDGPWTTWYPNGAKKGEGAYREGKKTGRTTFYYESGQPKARSTYEDDLRVGPSVNYRPDGTVESEGSYVAGKKEGPWRELDTKGQMILRHYRAGVEVEP